MNTVELRSHVRELIAPTVSALGFDLVAVEWSGDRRGSILRVSIEGPQGVDAHACASVSDAISPLLDADDPISGSYVLEVSSPGIDRPVQRREDFERFVGYRIKIRLVEGHPRRRYAGEIIELDDEELVLDVDGEHHRIHLDTIDRANLVLTLDEFQQLREARHDDQ